MEETVLDTPLTGPQWDFVFSEAKYPAIIGGLGSGKTAAGSARSQMLMSFEETCWIGYYMPTYDLINLRAIPGFEEYCDIHNIAYKTNKSKYYIDIEDLGRIIFRSYEKPNRIIAYQVAHSIVDELDTLPIEKARIVWRKVKERNRAPTKWPSGNTIGNVTTPDMGVFGFSYERWNDPGPEYESINAHTLSNIFLDDPEGYVQSIREEYDPIMAEAMIEGKFVNFSKDKVYHFFNRRKHHSNRKLRNSDSMIHVSIDFNVGGCCAVVWIIENNRPIAVKEFVSHDTMDFCIRLGTYKREHRDIIVYPDASGDSRSTNSSSTDIQLIKSSGFKVDCGDSNPPVRDRINAKNNLLSKQELLVNTDECPRYTHALETQGYDDKGEPQKFTEHPSIDDWNDSGGYFIYRKYPVTRFVLNTGIGRST